MTRVYIQTHAVPRRKDPPAPPMSLRPTGWERIPAPSLTAMAFGDPAPGRSALAQKRMERAA